MNLKRPEFGPKLLFDHCLPKSITDLEPEMGSHNNFRVPNDLAKKIKVKNLKEEKITINCHLSYPKGSVDRSDFCFGPWNSGNPTRIILCPNDLTIKEYPTKYLRFIERNMDLINRTTFRFGDYDSPSRANQNLQTEKLSNMRKVAV